jgi:dihydrofolate reductase
MKSKSKGLTRYAYIYFVLQPKIMSLTHSPAPRKLNQAGYDCVFLDGPHVLPMTSVVDVEGTLVEVENGKREHAKAWFLLSEEDPADASLSQSGIPLTYIGLDESLDILEKELLQDDEQVAVLGFSQGGVFCHILSVLAMRDKRAFRRITCAIIASGFFAQHVFSDTSPYQVDNLVGQKVSLPSLHLIGELDTSVNPKLSLQLASMFEESEILYHENGHILPQKSAQCATLISFLERNHKQDTM